VSSTAERGFARSLRSDYGSLTLIAADRTPEFAVRVPKTKSALAYAERLHDGQHRAVDGAPFIVHPIEVAMLLYESGAADDVIAAGALHDTLEKTDATAYDIYARFGRRVGDIVCAVSHDAAIPGYARRKAAVRNKVADAGEDALTVFAADKVSKVRELGLGDGAGLKVRSRKLRHYRLSLAMLQDRLPDSSLVAALAAELRALSHAVGVQPTPTSVRVRERADPKKLLRSRSLARKR
jgi:HD domain